MLPTVVAHLKKYNKINNPSILLFTSSLSLLPRADFMGALIECGICSALADWLKPLPDHSLPHQKIRENILDALKMVMHYVSVSVSVLTPSSHFLMVTFSRLVA